MSLPENVEVNTISLDSLPIEIFLIICDHIDANTLVRSLMYVNKQFYNIISDAYLWKKRVIRKFNGCDVAFMMTNTYNENTFNWKQFAWNTELEHNYWSKYETNTTSTIYKGAHFAEVDAVLLSEDGTNCMSAARDRSMCLWNIKSRDTIPMTNKVDGHRGWIWNLGTYDENHFLSCSWDSSVKLWNMPNFSAVVNPIRTFTAESAVLSITSKENFIAAGLYTSKVVAFDPRRSESIFQLKPHTRSVIDLCLIKDFYLVSLSEDKTLSIWDLRENQTVKTINLAKRGNIFPMCASYYDNVLFVGDSKDHMYWLDCSNGSFDKLGTVNFAKSNESQKYYKLNCIKCTNYGSIITGGNEGAVYIISPTNPPEVIARIVDSGSEITSIDYKNNTLVVGYVNSEVQVWQKN